MEHGTGHGRAVPGLPVRWGGALALCLSLLLAASCETTFGAKNEPPSLSRWSPEGGWTESPRGESSATAAAQRVEAQKAFDAEAYGDALQGLLAMQKGFPDSAEAGDGLTYFLIAECYLNLNDYEKAYDNYQKALKGRPSKQVMNTTLQRIYQIALFYLQERAKRTFAGVIPLSSASFGVEILTGKDGLITQYPFVEFAAEALLKIGRYYFNKKQYPEAERVYERLVRDYPGSEWREIAEYQLAVTIFKQVRGVDYDQGPLKKAEHRFNVYRKDYPRGSKIVQVKNYLREISELEAQHDLKIAKYYLRESRPEAARYYLEDVMNKHPYTEAFREAERIYRKMNYRRAETEAEGSSTSS